MKKKLAILDVDGTLFDGNLGIEFLRVLIESRIFSPDIGQQIIGWYKKYQTGEVEKYTAVDEIYKLYALGMFGLDQKIINQKAIETWEKIKPKMFTFVPELIDRLKKTNYVMILLSGSNIEMISQIGNYLNLDQSNYLAGVLEIINNKYTGKIISYPGSAQQKLAIFNEFILKNNIDVDYKNSLAIGDNERELEIMSLVGTPLPFNPDVVLNKIALEKHWPIANPNNILDFIVNRDH